MEPTDNFSQKKKKDLVAIAALFGILTEEKANRMTKPELIDFLAEQDRISKAASAPVQKRTEDISDDVLLRATDLLISTIEKSNMQTHAVAEMTVNGPVHKPAKVTVNVPVYTPAPVPVKKISAAAKKAVPVSASPGKPVEAPETVTASAADPAETTKQESTQAQVKIPAVKVTRKAAPASPKPEAPASPPIAAATSPKVSAPATKKDAVKPQKGQLAIPEPESIPAAAPVIVPESVHESTTESSPRRDVETISENTSLASTESASTAEPAVLQETSMKYSDAAASDDAGPVQKKRRGRPKKSSAETEAEVEAKAEGDVKSETTVDAAVITTPDAAALLPVQTTAILQTAAAAAADADAAAAAAKSQTGVKKQTSSRTDNKSHKESIVQEELDLEEVITTEVQVNRDLGNTVNEDADSEPSEKWNQLPVPSREHPVHKPLESAGEAAHHITRTKRHSVIIRPKDEEVSSQDEDVSAGAEPSRPVSSRPVSSRPVSPRSVREASLEEPDESGESEEMTGTAAPSGEHSEFSPHHARTLRPKEQQQEMLSGVLELMPDGYGFLRRENYLSGQNDIYVPAQYVRRFGLRLGDFVVGPCRPKRDSDRYQSLQYIKEVNGFPPEKMIRRAHFDRLTPIYPEEKYILETDRNELSTRIIDLVAPIGKGQRGMIVSPPKAGKTILLQKIANAISINNPDSKLIVLLIDERPEEVTDMQRSINGEVVYSTFDKTPENHVRIVELVLERAMRLVELGLDVIILLDSITRLARAYNLTINPTGRTLSGGLDPGALYGPKRFFGAARNIEGGGSLTIVATSLIDTGSRMDEVIFEEFKGTGNMEVYLDRRLSEKRIFPAIDINKSGTRHEELLLSPVELDAVWTIRKAFGQLDTSAVTEMIISILMKTATNNQLIQSINVSFNDKATFDAMRGTRPAGTSTNSGNGK